MLIGGLSHASIDFIICGWRRKSLIDRSQKGLWLLVLEDGFCRIMNFAVRLILQVCPEIYVKNLMHTNFDNQSHKVSPCSFQSPNSTSLVSRSTEN